MNIRKFVSIILMALVAISFLGIVVQPVSAAPSITSWYNNITVGNSTSITINVSESIYFNATANQTVDWTWKKDNITQSKDTTTYDFATCTSGTNCWAYENDVDQFPFGGSTSNRNDHTEPTAGEYTNISAPDANQWATDDPATSDEMLLWLEFEIDLVESPIDTITSIDFSFYGNTDTSPTTYTIWALKDGQAWEQDASWTQIGSSQSITNDVDTWMNRTMSSNFATYINSGTGKITWVVFSNRDGEDMRVNYVRMNVNYGTNDTYTTSFTAGGNHTVSVNGTNNNGTTQTITWSITVNGGDETPPASITNLQNNTYTYGHINWTWTNPTDDDFSYVKVHLDGVFKANVASPTNYYNATGLVGSTSYTISTYTVDVNGTVNTTWVNHTAATKPENLSDWNYNLTITIDNTGNAQNLTDYQVLVELDSSNFNFSLAQSDGSDLRFTNQSGSTLSHWIESYNSTSEEASVWVKVDSIVASDTTTITMYYGNPAATSASDYDNTFTKNSVLDGLIALWHMDEGSGTTTADFSGNSNDGTFKADGEPAWIGSDGGQWDSVNQQFSTGDSVDFDGTDDYLNVNPVADDIVGSDTMFAFWTKGGGESERLFTACKHSVYRDYFHITIDADGYIGSSFRPSNSFRWGIRTNDTYPTDEWIFVVMGHDGNEPYIYVNGELAEIIFRDVFPGALDNTYWLDDYGTPTRVDLGAFRTNGNPYHYYSGEMDEVRIYNRTMSEGEIRALYERREYTDPEPTVTVGEAPENLTDWNYNTTIAIDNTNNAQSLTDYQILVELDSSNFNFSQAQSDGDDLRFTNQSGGMLSYWIESYNSTSKEAKIWVKVDSIVALDTTNIIMYYGNPAAASASDGDATFEFFDDFEGAALSGSKWSGDTGSFSVSDGNLIANNIDDEKIIGNVNLTGRYIAETRCYLDDFGTHGMTPVGFRESSSNYYGSLTGTAVNSPCWQTYGRPGFYVLGDVGTQNQTCPDIDVRDAWLNVYVYAIGPESYVGFTRESDGHTESVNMTDNNLSSEKIWIGWRIDERVDVENFNTKWDWIYVRKYASTGSEPTVTVGEAPEDLSDWNYNLTITIDNTNNAQSLTDYQILVELDSSSFNFSQAQSDGDDLRFTNQSGGTLSYWIELFDSVNETASVWVKVDSIAALDTTAIIMYYGNPAVVSTSDGDATFEFFDDFPGSSVDTTKWGGDTGNFSVSDGYLQINDQDNKHLESATATFTGNYVAETRFYLDSLDRYGVTPVGFHENDTNHFGPYLAVAINDPLYPPPPLRLLCNGSRVVSIADFDTVDYWIRTKVYGIGSSGSKAEIIRESDGASETLSGTQCSLDSEKVWLGIRVDSFNCWGLTAKWDWVFVRKYTSAGSEPTVANICDVPQLLDATIDIDPDTLQIGSSGDPVTCYIGLPEYNVSQINISTVKLNDTVWAINDTKYDFVSEPEIEDRDNDGYPEFMVKFPRSDVEGIVTPGTVTLTVTGKLDNGTVFEGSDTISVINPPEATPIPSGGRRGDTITTEVTQPVQPSYITYVTTIVEHVTIIMINPTVTINIATSVAKDSLGNTLEISTNNLAITKMDSGILTLSIPVKLNPGKTLASFEDRDTGVTFQGNKMTIPMKDETGTAVADIIATTEDVFGTGSIAQAHVKKLQLETRDIGADFSSDAPDVGKASVKISADLSDVPSGASLKVKLLKTLDTNVQNAFTILAGQQGILIEDIAYGVVVEKTNLGGDTVGSANIILKVSRDWVDAYGGPDYIRIFRDDDEGTQEILETNYSCDKPCKNFTFKGNSKGLSTFALAVIRPELPGASPLPGLQDSDDDGWSDTHELAVGTDPYSRDTDGDGIPDAEDENPLDPSIPGKEAWIPKDVILTALGICILGLVATTILHLKKRRWKLF